MSTDTFPAELRTASFVPRWSVLWSLTRDSLTNHSFFVALYAHQIARLIRWDGSYGALLFYALTHDLDELSTGDVVGPAKKHIIDQDRFDVFTRAQMIKRFPDFVDQLDDIRASSMHESIRRIVKCADRLDVVLFLTMEERLGNKIVHERCREGIEALRQAWYALPCPGDQDEAMWVPAQTSMWATEILGAVEHHRKHGGIGI